MAMIFYGHNRTCTFRVIILLRHQANRLTNRGAITAENALTVAQSYYKLHEWQPRM